ncbi:unnamed protein product [Cyprideis torosa]|uniref:Uncharacterized protein n=1 Tax=Cyprideis torosa TaxID=163714 RepID=A0A7R8WGY0_9CRUS|nr:unnamed protein product [Cyprideis torosa]CAG0898717.1 unnamed protein product [Cyprideis torosa]
MPLFSKAKRYFSFYKKSKKPGPGDYDPQLPSSSSHASVSRSFVLFRTKPLDCRWIASSSLEIQLKEAEGRIEKLEEEKREVEEALEDVVLLLSITEKEREEINARLRNLIEQTGREKKELEEELHRVDAKFIAAKDVIRDMKVELKRLKGQHAFQHDDAEESAAAGRLTFCKEDKENEMGTSTKTYQRRFDTFKAFQHHEERTPLKGNRAQ